MSYFFKNTRKLSLSLSALLLAITLTMGSFAFLANGVPEMDGETVASEPMESLELEPGESALEVSRLSTGPAIAETAFNAPEEMNGVFLTPGADFITSKDASDDDIRVEIDKAVKAARDLSMNTVIIDTVYNDKVIYHTADSSPVSDGFDIMEYLVEKCRAAKLYTYAIFDASHYVGEGDLDKLSKNAGEFAGKYMLDGVLIDGYASEAVSVSYNDYLESGGSIGFENFKRQNSAAIVNTVAKAVHKGADNTTQAGLLAGAVWANSSDMDNGSKTKAQHTSLFSDNADTYGYVVRGYVDFVAVKAYSLLDDSSEPFEEIASWWGKAADESGIPMYIVYAASKIGGQEADWSLEQLEKQIDVAKAVNGYRGGMFNNLKKLPDNPAKSSTAIAATAVKDQSEPEIVPMSTAAANTPEAKQETTPDTTPVNSGYTPLDPNIEIIKQISPTGIIMAESNETIEVTAIAYKGANVGATINGEIVFMKLDESEDVDDAAYAMYRGAYTVPESEDDEDEEQILGSLSVYANYMNREETFDGAYMKVASDSDSSSSSDEKIPVQLIGEAKTYPANTKNNVPIPSMYPLPKGATDYAVGDEFSYKSDKNKIYTYRVLASGVRVESRFLKEISKGPKSNNVTGMSVTAPDDGFTYVTLNTEQKVTYSFVYKADSVEIILNNTVSVPGGGSLESNPMFTKATWSGKNKLTLTLAKKNGFMGFKGYYDSDGNLVFRFNNPPTSIKNARIAIDPGHGGKDFGALGTDSKYPEKVINLAIAQKLEKELVARGATVILLDSAGIEGPERAEMAEKWNADLLVSVHSNTAANKSAAGTEVYYFYPYSRQFAVNSASNVSTLFDTTNRGAKLSYYHVTLSPQMASVLVECGFMTNATEYKKLMKSKSQQNIATGIADSIEGAIKTAKTGVVATGSESTGSKASSSNDDDEDSNSDESTGGGEITKLTLSTDYDTIAVDGSTKIFVSYEPEDADDKSVTWKSSSSSVASVDSKGIVTGLKTGSTTITATAADGSKKKASIKIKVSDDAELFNVEDTDDDTSSSTSSNAGSDTGIALKNAGEVWIDDNYLTIYPKNTERIEVLSEKDKVVRNSEFKWKSSKTSVATVDAYGVVTAKAEGNTLITATSGDITLDCDVEVSKTKVTATGITINKTSTTIVRGKTEQLKVTFTPKGVTDKTVTWTSSKSKIASVDKNGIVKGVNVGTATITGKSKNGGYKVTCEVEIIRKDIPFDYIEMDETLEIRKGDTDTLYFELSPSDATVSDSVTWKSSNSSVVSVDEEGNIEALKKGTATITVTTVADKSVYAKCKITVF